MSVFLPVWLGSFTQGQSSLSFVFTTVVPLTGGGTARHSQPSVDKEQFAYLLSRNACVEEEVIRFKISMANVHVWETYTHCLVWGLRWIYTLFFICLWAGMSLWVKISITCLCCLAVDFYVVVKSPTYFKILFNSSRIIFVNSVRLPLWQFTSYRLLWVLRNFVTK